MGVVQQLRLLCLRPSFSVVCFVVISCRFVVRWLVGSLAFFVWDCGVGKNANVPTKALAISLQSLILFQLLLFRLSQIVMFSML